MRNNFSYHLRHLYNAAGLDPQANKMSKRSSLPARAPVTKVIIPEEFSPRDYLAYLTSIDAELEHALMLQYLYAAYSFGGSDVPKEAQENVRCWQEIILGIAKEEMGHFISVQNVLRLIGAPLHFERQDYPWDTPFYPFPFKLEPLTKDSLAKYIYAESPEGWINKEITDDPEMEEIRQEIQAIIEGLSVEEHFGPPISALFEQILALIKDEELLPNEIFQAKTYPFQAKFDEWGRGYAGGSRGNTHADCGHTKGSPDVLVVPMSSRDSAIDAITKISLQGEATDDKENDDLPSHFERFITVYKGIRNIKWSPSRHLAVNPYISSPDFTEPTNQSTCSDSQQDAVSNPVAVQWSHLLNVRYRMLLTFITHSFVLDGGYNQSGAFSPRGTIINASFGEMYNLRSISHVLVKTPIDPPGKEGSGKFAGPGFLVPYTLDLPTNEHNRWRVHQDLLIAAQVIIDKLFELPLADADKDYLYSLQQADANLLVIVRKMID